MPFVRLLVIVLAIVAGVVLVACGSDDDSDTVSQAVSSPTAASASSGADTGTPQIEQDLVFIDAMIMHHQSAIDMAEMVRDSAKRSEIQDLAADVIREQQHEIEQMMEWRDAWYPGAPESDLSNMMHMAGMHMSQGDMDSMLHADDVDMEFMEQMIPHHESAVEMARNILETTEREELRALAEAIIEAQVTEIEQMREWMREWSHQ
jgi:uncharacterized protein (DUF305 family)